LKKGRKVVKRKTRRRETRDGLLLSNQGKDIHTCDVRYQEKGGGRSFHQAGGCVRPILKGENIPKKDIVPRRAFVRLKKGGGGGWTPPNERRKGTQKKMSTQERGKPGTTDPKKGGKHWAHNDLLVGQRLAEKSCSLIIGEGSHEKNVRGGARKGGKKRGF